MMKGKYKVRHFFHRWRKDEDGQAAMESVFVFPLLSFMLLGLFDMGYAMLASQKVVRASQVAADLVARYEEMTPQDMREVVDASRLAMLPFDRTQLGIDIWHIQYDDEGNAEQVWRCNETLPEGQTFQMPDVAGMGQPGEGIIVVTAYYDFEPTFSTFAVGGISMDNRTYIKARQTDIIDLSSCGL